MSGEHILITGATGLVGRSAMQYYAERGYKVTAISRRRPFNTYGASWHSLDLANAAACAELLSPLTDIVQIVFAALHEESNLVAGWVDKKQIDRNEAMLRNTVEAVASSAKDLRNITILQGPKAYGVHVHPIRHGAREDRDEDRDIPNFYWAQEDYLKQRQVGQNWGWNVLRPALVIGLSERGEPFYYPGEGLAIADSTDSDLIAKACEWMLQEPKAKNQCYNLTNGETSSLKEWWHLIAESLHIQPGPEKPFAFTNDLQSFSEEWDQVRKKYNLKAPALSEFLGQSGQFADFVFAKGNRPPASMSCIKIRRDGFTGTIYTEEMIGKWFKMYQDEKILPSAEGTGTVDHMGKL